jgi:hypothetical protein
MANVSPRHETIFNGFSVAHAVILQNFQKYSNKKMDSEFSRFVEHISPEFIEEREILH